MRLKDSSEPTTNLVEKGGAAPTQPLQKTPTVGRLTAAEVNVLLTAWHYLGPVIGIIAAYGHHEGCCVFTNCRSRHYAKNACVPVLELARMVGIDNHIWAMSSLMSQSVKQLRHDFPEVRRLVTFADPTVGHSGNVYRSANWIDEGLVPPAGNPVFWLDNKIISPRTLYDRHGTQARTVMQEIYGDRLIMRKRQPKRRFILNI